jgi:hypothetical protein
LLLSVTHFLAGGACPQSMEAWQLSTLTYAPFRRQLRAQRRPVFDLKSSDRRCPIVWARFLRKAFLRNALGRGQSLGGRE